MSVNTQTGRAVTAAVTQQCERRWRYGQQARVRAGYGASVRPVASNVVGRLVTAGNGGSLELSQYRALERWTRANNGCGDNKIAAVTVFSSLELSLSLAH